MKLASRISLFFLAALAVVLVGFSVSTYAIVRAQLDRQLYDRCDATLDTICASIEWTDAGLEWEPAERNLTFSAAVFDKTLMWLVLNSSGERIDGSSQSGPLLKALADAGDDGTTGSRDAAWDGQRWRISRRELQSPKATEDVVLKNSANPNRYARLSVVVATSLEPIAAQLRNLALALLAISGVVWCAAALFGGWLCRKMLAPLTRMTNAISSISPSKLSQRLDPIRTEDQLGELTKAFNELLDRLQASFERQRRFAADASHQLRTPLTSMLGHAEVCLRRDRSTSEYRSVIENIRDQSTQLSQIIEMLLFLAREGADVIGPSCHPFELNDWLVGYLPHWNQHARFADVQLEVDPEAELAIRAHEGLLGQALDNLVDNAFKYSEPGSPIVVRTYRTNGVIALEVEDSGCGISPAEIAHVRVPFFRSDDVRRQGVSGVGLGLSVTQQIVTAFGATLTIRSVPGRGSVVTIAFPAEVTIEPPSRQGRQN